jgi:hypothetical protein
MYKNMSTFIMTEKQIAKFWAKINILGPDDCWEWKSPTSSKGYGRYTVGGKTIYAHRIAWELTHGSIPKGLFVCHHCDNRKCINPNHMFLGTNQDNVDDMVNKGRNFIPKGEKQGSAKLTEEQVMEIRRLYTTLECTSREILGKLYNVSSRQISAIINREYWRHI